MARLHIAHQQCAVIQHGLVKIGDDCQVGIVVVGLDLFFKAIGGKLKPLTLQRDRFCRLLLVAQPHGVLSLGAARIVVGYGLPCH